jgi:uroporphyrinogen-III decarboxylase
MYDFSFLVSWMLFIDSETHAKNNYLPILQSVREITGKNVPVWDWWSAGAYLPLHVFGPEKYGGLGDVADKARQAAEATGRDVEEVTKDVGPYFQYQYWYWRLISN